MKVFDDYIIIKIIILILITFHLGSTHVQCIFLPENLHVLPKRFATGISTVFMPLRQ